MHLITQILKPASFTLCLALLVTAWLPLESLATDATQIADNEPTSTGISSDVADAILKELKEIRRVLEKIEKQGGTQRARRTQPKTAMIPTKGKPALGAANAPLTVVEFTDYQCSYCLRFSKTTFPQLKTKYIDTGKVRWVALNLPLSFHKDARKAAQATLCAGEQGKFWEMREKLFQHQNKLGTQHLINYAQSLPIDTKTFHSCLQSDRHLAEIDKDTSNAKSLRLTGTPSFIIGKTSSDVISGQVVIGAQPLNVFEAAITKKLNEKITGRNNTLPSSTRYKSHKPQI